MNRNSKVVAFYGMLLALFYLVWLVEVYVTSIAKLTPFETTVLPLTLCFFMCTLKDFKNAAIVGCILGVGCLLVAFTFGIALFYNPIITVLPRFLVGCVFYGVFALLKKYNDILAVVIAGAVATLINTVCVLAMLSLFNVSILFGPAFNAALVINFPIEIICSPILAVLLYKSLSGKIKYDFNN